MNGWKWSEEKCEVIFGVKKEIVLLDRKMGNDVYEKAVYLFSI